MFVNKINSVSNMGFKGDKEDCEIQFFRAVPTDKYNHKIVETPLASVKLKPEGVDVNLQELTNLDKNAPFAYKVIRRDKTTGKVIWEGADTGMKVKPENGEFVYRVSSGQWIKEIKDKDGKTGYAEDTL